MGWGIRLPAAHSSSLCSICFFFFNWRIIALQNFVVFCFLYFEELSQSKDSAPWCPFNEKEWKRRTCAIALSIRQHTNTHSLQCEKHLFQGFPRQRHHWNPSSRHWNSSLQCKDAAGYTVDRRLETRVLGRALNKMGIPKAGSRRNVSRECLSWRSSKQSTLQGLVCVLYLPRRPFPFECKY